MKKTSYLKRSFALILSILLLSGSLPLNAFAVDEEYICGKEEHTHTAECFSSGSSTEFACLQSLEGQTVVHEHDDWCYDDAGNLICPLEEREAHEHSDACYHEEQRLICEQEEGGHTHTDDCYTVESVLICTEPESETHTHEGMCYEETRTLTCEEQESDGHTHTEDCYEYDKVLECGQEELIPHTHGSSCYDESGELRCGLPEAYIHQHNESCMAESAPTDMPVCGLEEHAHDESCLAEAEISDPSAEPDTAENEDVEGPNFEAPPANDIFGEPAEITEQGANNIIVNHYVSIDGSWQSAGQTTIAYGPERFGANILGWGGTDRYYLTESQLESIYGEYGFSAASFDGELYFPHASYGEATMWADAEPEEDDNGSWMIPIGSSAATYDMYYLPANRRGTDSYFDSSKSISDTTLLRDNSFYSITVSDPEGLDDSNQYPIESRILSGGSYSITLPLKCSDLDAGHQDIAWDVGGSYDLVDREIDADGNLKLTIHGVAGPISIRSRAGLDEAYPSYKVEYTTNVTMETISGSISADNQSVAEPMTVNDSESYVDSMEVFPADGYEILAPDEPYAITRFGNDTLPKKFYYVFQGWRLGGQLYQPGDTISMEKFNQYADSNDKITLEAEYSPFDQSGKICTINLYVNLACEIMDTAGSSQSQTSSGYTGSVYATRIFGTENFTGEELIASSDDSSAYAVNEQIRDMVDTPINSITIEDFPSDEEVLSAIRKEGKQISLDGEVIPQEELIPDNFTVRWYVVKYDASDGWHVDGILVAKAAKLVITKTFAGDNEAIQEAKDNGFYLSLRPTSGSGTNVALTLSPTTAAREDYQVGYTSYDEKSKTYTWTVDVRQGQQYAIQEQNYTLADTLKWTSTSQYMIENSDDHTDGWEDYTGTPIYVTAESYAADAPTSSYQTVRFTNTYVQAGLLTIYKIDSETYHGLPGITFDLSYADGRDFNMYRRPGEHTYSLEPDSPSYGYTEQCPDHQIQTDEAGYIYLELPVGTYRLAEHIPTGYDAAREIEITVTNDGIIDIASVVISGEMPPEGGWIEGENTSTLTIKNHSKLLTKVRAEKDWGSTPESEQKPVTVELWRDGAKMTGSEYQQVLSQANGWAYEWTDLPLFTDLDMAEYSLRETKIGDTPYDASADEDGYANYVVTLDAPLYRENGGEYQQQGYWEDDTGTIHYANEALLRIHNRQALGLIGFMKVNDAGTPLPGATFGLFSDPECANQVATAVSDGSGYVEFAGQQADTYYLKEIAAPDGYSVDGTVYRVIIEKGESTIYAEGDTAVAQIVNVRDQNAVRLPNAGGMGTAGIYALGLLLVGGAVVFLLIYRKRR